VASNWSIQKLPDNLGKRPPKRQQCHAHSRKSFAVAELPAAVNDVTAFTVIAAAATRSRTDLL
jgi:hypothetical protein